MFRRAGKQISKKGVVSRLIGTANKSAPKPGTRSRPKVQRPASPESPKTVFTPSQRTAPVPVTKRVVAQSAQVKAVESQRQIQRPGAYKGAPPLVMRVGRDVMKNKRPGVFGGQQSRTYLTQAGGLPDDVSSLCVYGSNTVVFSLHDLLEHKPQALPKDITLIVPDFWLEMVLKGIGNESLACNKWGQSFSDLDDILREILLEIDPFVPEELRMDWEHYYAMREVIIAKLKARGVHVISGDIKAINVCEDESVDVQLESGQTLHFDDKAKFLAWHGHLKKIGGLEQTVVDFFQDPSLRQVGENESIYLDSDAVVDQPSLVPHPTDLSGLGLQDAPLGSYNGAGVIDDLSPEQEAVLDAMLLVGLGADDANFARLEKKAPGLYQHVTAAGRDTFRQAANRACSKEDLAARSHNAFHAQVALSFPNMALLAKGVDAAGLLPPSIANLSQQEKIDMITLMADELSYAKSSAIGQVGASQSAQWMRGLAKDKQFACIGLKEDIEGAKPRDNAGSDHNCVFFDSARYAVHMDDAGKWGFIVDLKDKIRPVRVGPMLLFFLAIGYTGEPTQKLFAPLDLLKKTIHPDVLEAMKKTFDRQVNPGAILQGSMPYHLAHIRDVNRVESRMQTSRYDKAAFKKALITTVAKTEYADVLLPHLNDHYFEMVAAGHSSLAHAIESYNAMHFADWVLDYKVMSEGGERFDQDVHAAFMQAFYKAMDLECKASREAIARNKGLSKQGKTQRDVDMHHAQTVRPQVQKERLKHDGVGSIEHMHYHTIAHDTGEHPDEVRARLQKGTSAKRLQSNQLPKSIRKQPE